MSDDHKEQPATHGSARFKITEKILMLMHNSADGNKRATGALRHNKTAKHHGHA